MTRSRTRRPAARIALVAAAAFFTFAAVGFDAPAAQAHDQILEQTPTDATHVALVPDEVTVLFSNDLIEVGAVMLVVDTNEVDWADGPVQLRGPIAAQPLKPNTPDGAYTVRWRVVSSDGHPISGAFSFTAGDSPPSQAQQPTAAITPPQDDDESLAQTGAADMVASDEANDRAASTEPGGAVVRILGMAGLGAAIGAAVYITFIFIRRRAT